MEKSYSFEEIEIGGCIDIRKNPVSVDEFTDKFIEWIESNNWYFGGGIKEYDDDGNT